MRYFTIPCFFSNFFLASLNLAFHFTVRAVFETSLQLKDKFAFGFTAKNTRKTNKIAQHSSARSHTSFMSKVLSGRSVFHNNKVLQYVQDSTSLMSGCCCGLLQLQSFAGFTFFLIQFLSIGVLFSAWFCKGQASRYFDSPVQEIFINNVFRGLAGFLMTWTFVYALIA